MKVHDLVRVHSDPLEGPVSIPEGVLGVIVELRGLTAKVRFPDTIPLTYRIFDLTTVD